MAGEKLHTCTLTVSPLHGPIPCEACAEMPRCPHGMRAEVDMCDGCTLGRADHVILAARAVVSVNAGRSLEERIETLRTMLATVDKWGHRASVS